MITSSQGWSDPNKSSYYLNKVKIYSNCLPGEVVLLESIPKTTKRIFDLGSGDGRTIKLIKENFPDKSDIEYTALDLSPSMLEALESNFKNDSSVIIIKHDLDDPFWHRLLKWSRNKPNKPRQEKIDFFSLVDHGFVASWDKKTGKGIQRRIKQPGKVFYPLLKQLPILDC